MARLEDLFLGRERVVTLVDGTKLKVRQLPGASDIFVAPNGSIVMPRWSGKEEGKTPLKRRRKKWSPKELGYVVYSQGLPAALRSRQLALFQAQKISAPTYEQALAVFADEVREYIIINGTMDPQKISPDLRRKLQAFGFVFQRAQKLGVKEAMVKILFLYQDEKSGLNVGAMLVRTVAITDRLRERLLGMYGWVRKYLAQENSLSAIDQLVKDTINQAAKQLDYLWREIREFSGPGNRKTQKLIIDKLARLSLRLEPLKLIQPFSRWMAFVMEDFDEMTQAIKTKDKQGFVLACALTERILFSIRLKSIQRSLDRLLLRVGQDMVIKKFDWNHYAVWTAALAYNLSVLVGQETTVRLREKVCEAAYWLLLSAALEAEEAVKENNENRRLKAFKAALKRAYTIL